MSFKEFDLSDYIHALEDFKSNQTEEVKKHWGSVENFDKFIQKIRKDESEVAKPFINTLIDTYYNDSIQHITDRKYGKEASDYIIKAFRYYSENNSARNN